MKEYKQEVDLCPYAKLFGERNKGFHRARLFDIAINDTIATIIGAYIISYITNYNFYIVLLLLFILGEYLHYIFGVDTKVLEILGIPRNC
jgi:uncharacterized membrane protein YcaP (DUF421 family)